MFGLWDKAVSIGKRKYRILLLTNRDSDNVGDQVIEACDLALIKAVMKNLKVKEEEYEIDSQAASIVSKKYLSEKEDSLLKTAEWHIRKSDVVIFGGAPLFNYQYQVFYERTAVTLEIARKYRKPVIFSAIGIEGYDEDNKKCQRLKKTLNFDCVKQITTRDGMEDLKKYKSNPDLVIARVCDPAVFSAETFRNYLAPQKTGTVKKVGIFVFRANGFKDNKIDFSRHDSVDLWKDMIRELESRGYDYRLLTSGHFGDEAFLDYLIREHGIEEEKCIFNMNAPEKLVAEISGFDAVVSCRLHPSIIAYSLDIPSIGLIWNPKVKYFYDCIGYPDRRMDVCGIEAKRAVDKLEEIMGEGIRKDGDYLMSVYHYLFQGIKKALHLKQETPEVYDYGELSENLPPFEGTSEEEQEEKLKRKFRRMYETLNTRAEINANLKEELQRWKNVTGSFEMSYHSKAKGEEVLALEGWKNSLTGEMKRAASGAMVCRLPEKMKNDGSETFAENVYGNGTKKFCGWRLRFRIGELWFWYLEDGSFCRKDGYDRAVNKKIKVFLPGEPIPYLPLMGIDTVVAEAKWRIKKEKKTAE